MIGSVRGKLADICVWPGKESQPEVLVDVAGLGYRLLVSPRTLVNLGEIGTDVFVHVHTNVRDDAIDLYGFISREERDCFEALIATHGVGPSVALAILSVHTPAELRRVLATDDTDALTQVPGIGKKTAARLFIELKSRLDLPDLEVVPTDRGAPGYCRSEVRAALAGLGYGPDEVRQTVQSLPDTGSTEELLKTALRHLAAAR